ncbi:TPA: PTS system mannose/fructose/sorbose family transporter subunit IID, partial [Enterococcus faecium]|nr:PTS system mannose/fructose/sorbose family transporter subunit IID [Enterococcus faecium]
MSAEMTVATEKKVTKLDLLKAWWKWTLAVEV